MWSSIENNPVALTEALRQVILMLILFEAIHWTEAQTIGLLSAISAVIAIFVRSNTVAAPRVEQKVEERVAHREMTGQTGTGSGMGAFTGPPGAGSDVQGSFVKTSASKNIIPMVLVTVLLAGSMACTKGAHIATQAEDVVHDGLIAFDHALDARCDAGALTPDTCKTLNQFLVPVWDVKNEITKAILGKQTESLATRFVTLQNAIKELAAQVEKLVAGGAKQLLLDELALALTQVKGGAQ
jgi:hypothetical protein